MGEVVTRYSTKQIAHLAGIGADRLDKWCIRGVLVPSLASGLRGHHGGRERREWSLADAIIVRTMAALSRGGIKPRELRMIAREMARYGASLAAATLYVVGHDVIVQPANCPAYSALNAPGQIVMSMSLAPIAQEVDQAVETLAA